MHVALAVGVCVGMCLCVRMCVCVCMCCLANSHCKKSSLVTGSVRIAWTSVTSETERMKL